LCSSKKKREKAGLSSFFLLEFKVQEKKRRNGEKLRVVLKKY